VSLFAFFEALVCCTAAGWFAGFLDHQIALFQCASLELHAAAAAYCDQFSSDALIQMSTQTWNCAMCTFENGVLDVQCIMCETPAPAAAANVPVESAAESPALNASTSPAVVRITAEPSAEPQWFQSWDEGRRMFFYFNRATQESVWEPPQGFPFVPHVGPTPGKVSAPQSSREAGRGPSPAVRNFSRFESPAEPAAAAAPPVVDVEPVTVAPASTPASAAPTPAAAAPTPAAAAAPVVQPGAGQQLLRSTLAEQARSSGITQNLHPESKLHHD